VGTFALSAPLSAGLLATGQCAGVSPCTAVLDNWATISNLGTFLDGVTHSVTGQDALGQILYTGTLRSAVYRNSLNNQLDFYYQFVNNPTSLDAISRITMTSFGAFTTDVGYTTQDIDGTSGGGSPVKSNFVQNATLMQAPSVANRPSQGTVGFNFGSGSAPADAIDPGETTRILVIRTNALAYTIGATSTLNGAVATYQTFAPTNIPEPGTYALMGAGLVALGLAHRKQR
jgi:hypothetical protein